MEQTAGDRARLFREMFADEQAFRSWYDRAFPVLYSFVFARLGGDADVATEIIQEAFVEGVRNRGRFDGSSDPVTWLCGIARHKVADYFRRLERERRRKLKLIRDEHRPDPGTSHGVETQDAVLGAIRSLLPVQRAVLTMHYLDDMPVKEIASALGRSVSAVESLLARARDNFRRAYPQSAGASDER